MIPERIVWELDIIRERINEMIPEYEKHKPIRQEHITAIKLDEDKRALIIRFNTYLFRVNHPEETYVLSWYHKRGDSEKDYIKDGMVECSDLSSVVRTIDDCLYGAFNPDRAAWWQLHPRPKNFSRKRNWGP